MGETACTLYQAGALYQLTQRDTAVSVYISLYSLIRAIQPYSTRDTRIVSKALGAIQRIQRIQRVYSIQLDTIPLRR